MTSFLFTVTMGGSKYYSNIMTRGSIYYGGQNIISHRFKLSCVVLMTAVARVHN